jgi:hypothetical protein
MVNTEDLPQVIEKIWTRCGLNLEGATEALGPYWAKIGTAPPMDPKHSGDINQKHWAWFNANILGAMPEVLLRFLRAHRGKATAAAVSIEGWQASVNRAIDSLKVPMERFICTQALIPLLAPVIPVRQLPFIRFETPLGGTGEAPKPVLDEIHAALEDEDRSRQREDFDDARHKSLSTLTNAELHYASLLSLPLMASVEAGLIDAADLLREMVATADSPLRLNHLYPGDRFQVYYGGVPEQLSIFLIPRHRDLFISLLPPVAVLDSALPLYQVKGFMALMKTNEDLFEAFLVSLNKSFFVREAENMHFSHLVPPNRWLAYARAAHCHGLVLLPYVDKHNRQEFDKEFFVWCRQLPENDLPPKLRRALMRLLMVFEPSEKILGCLRYMNDTNRKVSTPVFTSWDMQELVKTIDDSGVLMTVATDMDFDREVRRRAMDRYEDIRKDVPWQEFHSLAEKHPEMLLDSCIFPWPNHDVQLLEKVWQASQNSTKAAELIKRVLGAILNPRYLGRSDSALSAKRENPLKPLAHQAIDRLPELAAEILLSRTSSYFHEIEWYESFGHPLVERMLLKLCVASSEYQQRLNDGAGWEDTQAWFKKVRGLVATCPQDLLSLSPMQLRDVLRVIDSPKNIAQLSPFVFEQSLINSTKELHLFLAQWLVPVPLAVLRDLGWLDPKFRRFEAVTVEMLLRRAEPEALQMLEEIFPRIKNQTLRDRILDKLAQAGVPIGALDELDGLDAAGLERLAQAKIPKKMSAATLKVWREDLSERFAPLTPSLLQWLFMLCEQTTADQVPRTARRILGLIDRERQALLVIHLFEAWFAHKGDAALEWAVLLLDDYADDRMVPFFVQAVKHWNKKSKSKTNKIIGWLGRLGSVYAVAQIKQIFEGHYSGAIIRHCRQVLSQIADGRDLTLEELFEELTPTLGYTPEGLVLDVGHQVYHARLDTRGALVVFDEQGKKSKSLPACKKEDDPALHDAAKSKLSFFKKNLKPILKQQALNFYHYLHQGKQWPAARWQMLFLDHALLAAMGQSLIWDGLQPNGERIGFRFSEDHALLTLSDDTVDPEALESVRLWHPLEWDGANQAAWAAHLMDYKLTPLIDQVSAPTHLLTEEERSAQQLDRYQGHVTAQGSFRHILKKNGFAQEATGDGGNFYGHLLFSGARQLRVVVHHTAMTAWMEVDSEAAIEKVSFYDTQAQKELTLAEVNPRLMAWVIDILAQIAEKGEGYRADWRSLR